MIDLFRKKESLYYLIPVGLILFQLIFTLNSMTQLRYEELAEGIRNVYWLEHHAVYDGVSTNIGWFGIQLVIFKIFGFSLWATKYFRVGFELASLLSLAYLLKKYLTIKWAILPLITIALSPTMLYLNTLQTEYGFDLQLIPVLLFLITILDFKKLKLSILIQTCFWMLLMIGWMSYPIYILYLPIFGILYLIKLWPYLKKGLTLQYLHLVLSLIAFLAPLIFGIIYIQNRDLLWYDPSNQGGMFRGAGTISLDGDEFSKNLSATYTNFFQEATSYHFELNSVEFSRLLPLFSVLGVSGLTIFFLFSKQKLSKQTKFWIVSAWTLMILNLILVSLTVDPSGQPGLRRNTPILISFYALYCIAWWIISQAKFVSQKYYLVAIGCLLILPIHHFLVFPTNVLHLKDPSPYRENQWLVTAETPDKSVNSMIAQLQQQDLKLGCTDRGCRYPEIFSILQGECEWNHLSCHQVLGFDPLTQKYLPLNIDLWQSHYFEH